MGGKLEFLCGYNLVPALVLDFGGVSLMGWASDVPFHKILWLPVLMVCLDRVGWKEKRKGEEVAGMYFVSVHPSLFHFSLLLSSSPISFYTNIGIG